MRGREDAHSHLREVSRDQARQHVQAGDDLGLLELPWQLLVGDALVVHREQDAVLPTVHERVDGVADDRQHDEQQGYAAAAPEHAQHVFSIGIALHEVGDR